MDPLILLLVLMFIVIFLSAMAESSLLSISNLDIVEITKKYPSIGQIWKKLKNNIKHSITLVLILNTLGLIAAAAIGGAFLFKSARFNLMITFVSLFLAWFVLQWGVVLPRTLGISFKIPLAIVMAYPLYFLTVLFTPLIMMVEFFNKPFEKKDSNAGISVAEIAELAKSAALEKKISREQARLIERSVDLSKMNASDIMVKSADMNILSDTMTLNEALIAAHMHHHTRFPLVKNGNVNAIVGYVNFKDIVGALRLNPSDPTLNGIKRPLEIVTDTTPLSELLRKFTRGYQHIGVVKNKQGETLGMVTLEDLIEMLVGDLEDEYDKSPELFVQLAENRFRAGGGVTFEQLSVRVCNKLPSWDLTIDEWILGQCAGVIPENYAIVYQNVSFKVRRIARGHVFDVIIERIPD